MGLIMNSNNKYTPKLICKSNRRFNIPIYQRLFEWGKVQIEQLLNDLYNQYEKDSNAPYYIGMLTLYKNDLVDGQQRFTVLSIIASVFKDYYEGWKNMKEKLTLTARPYDEKYLESLFDTTSSEQEEYKNIKMFNGKECIQEWISDKNIETEVINSFSKYVYEHCTFFTAELPEKYEAKDLNSYFEAMNSTGRNLEAHEIIKVRDYLKSMQTEQEKYTLIWNLVSDMDRPLIRKKENESEEDLRNRFTESISNFEKNLTCPNFNNYINDYKLDDTNHTTAQEGGSSIKDIKESYRNPDVRRQDKYYGEGYHSMLNFPEFLLQILFIHLNFKIEDISVINFFSTHNLINTFEEHTKTWEEENWKSFGRELLLFRLIYDYYFIQVANSEGSDYYLKATDADNSNSSTILKQYESFLYADSTSLTYYRWIAPLLKYIKENKELTVRDVIINLHKIDDSVQEHKQEHVKDEELVYSSQKTVYFLRRLDFFLWLANENSEKVDPLISSYIFRRGINSKEHLHPQTEKDYVSTNDGWESALNSFGNLFLISQSSNSTQSNNGINGKFINFSDQVNNGYIESIKLLIVYNNERNSFATWTPKKVEEHQKVMIEFLQKTYDDTFMQLKFPQ